MELEDFFRDTQTNAVISWLLAGLTAAVFIESFLPLDILWIIFSGLTLTIISLPAIIYRNKLVVPPWEVIIIAVIPLLVRTFDVSILANEIATYTAIAAVALIIAVELHIFTSIKFSHGFAIMFTVVSTLAIGGIWSILRFIMDSYFGTGFLTTNEALMEEYFNILLAGILAGVLFDLYFRRRDRVLRKMLRKVIQ